MKESEKWKIYMNWCRENRCATKFCSSNKEYICEHIEGIKGCRAWKDTGLKLKTGEW